MAINSLPSGLQETIQQGYLDRAFESNLKPNLAYRAIADREPFLNKIGETVTKTRPGLLAPTVTTLAPAASTDLTSGLTFNDFSVEQYTLSVAQIGAGAKTNIVTEGVAIESKFLQDAKGLGQQAAQSVDRLARNALFTAYMGGNTRVRTTLGSANATVAVDDVRGFSAGQTVLVGATDYTVSSIATDGTNHSTLIIIDDTANAVSGQSGTITFSTSVSTTDGTAGNQVMATTAPLIYRPNAAVTTAAINGTLTAEQIMLAVAGLRDDGVQEHNGYYNCYINNRQLSGLQLDPIYQNYVKTNLDSSAFKRGYIVEGLGVRMIFTTETPMQKLAGNTVNRAMVVGQGALVEGVYTNNGYKNQDSIRETAHVSVTDGIAHIVDGPLDALQQWATQAWVYIGGFVVPTDIGTNSQVMPTASNSSYKRAAILESF